MSTDAILHRRWLRQKQAADYTGLSESTLEKRRVSGLGPAFSKAGRVVLYDIAVLDEWLSATSRRSTSDVAVAA